MSDHRPSREALMEAWGFIPEHTRAIALLDLMEYRPKLFAEFMSPKMAEKWMRARASVNLEDVK